MMSLIAFVEALLSIKIHRIAEGAWELVGKDKARKLLDRRAGAYDQHLRTKHPEWFLANGAMRIPANVPPAVRLLAHFYSIRCAASRARCKHKP
jgi:hypothetical protein